MTGPVRARVGWALCLLCAPLAAGYNDTAEFRSAPVAHDGHQPLNRFSKRTAVAAADVFFGRDASRFDSTVPCHHSMDVAWASEVGSSVYSTPAITDLFGDGRKEVVVPTFAHYFEVLDGETGVDAEGWPYTHSGIASHASVVVHDIDHDGHNDLMYSTANAELLFFRDSGEPVLGRTMKVPPLKVQKRWYDTAGDTDAVNAKFLREAEDQRQRHRDWKWRAEHSGHRDHDGLPVLEVETPEGRTIRAKEAEHAEGRLHARLGNPTDLKTEDLARLVGEQQHGAGRPPHRGTVPLPADPAHAQPPIKVQTHENHATTYAPPAGTAPSATPAPVGGPAPAHSDHPAAPAAGRGGPPTHRRLLQAEAGEVPEDAPEDAWGGGIDAEAEWPGGEDDDDWRDPYYDGGAANGKMGTESGLSDEARASMGLVFGQVVAAADPLPLLPDRDPLFAPNFDPSQYAHTNDSVWVDAHVLATPVIVDLDMDDAEEIVVPVSYYFEKELYKDPRRAALLPPDVDPDNYVSGGVVVLDLATGRVKWARQLDLTTNKVQNRAFVYSGPTVVDLDGDGKLEIVQSTSQGFIYVFSHEGRLRRGFPKFMAEIQGQVAVADVDEDGRPDLCAVDFRSNVACFDRDGGDVWDRQISGVSSQAVSFGDIDGNGHLDLVIGTSTGHVWALEGKTGETLPHFPVKTGGAVYAPALLVNLNNTDPKAAAHPGGGSGGGGPHGGAGGLHVVLPSHDGFLYIIDGRSACIDKVDIGENAYGMVLADDLSGDGHLDLVVSTMNGNVYVLNTETRFHPLKAWTSQTQGLNGFTAKEGYQGIMISPESRVQRDVVGDHFKIMFEIVDQRPHARGSFHRKYHVRITVGRSVVVLSKTYYRATRFVEIVRAPTQRMQGTLYLTMRNEYGQYFEDSLPISFNMHFYNAIKWLVLLPFGLLAVVLSLNKASNDSIARDVPEDDGHDHTNG